MNEGAGYRRMEDRPAGPGPAWPMVQNEVQGAFRSFWGRLAFLGVAVFAVMYVGSLFTLEQSQPGSGHTMDAFLAFMGFMRWGGLILAAVIAGPPLLEDARRGALELYLAHPIRHRIYLLAKSLSALALVTLIVWLPALLYYLLSFFLFEANPVEWNWVPLRSLVYALLWSVPITGAGFAISCLAGSGRAASLWLFGTVFVLDIFVSGLLSAITQEAGFNVLSPLAMHAQQTEWLWHEPAPYAFPDWWGLIGLAAITVVGWGTLTRRYPRLHGGDA